MPCSIYTLTEQYQGDGQKEVQSLRTHKSGVPEGIIRLDSYTGQEGEARQVQGDGGVGRDDGVDGGVINNQRIPYSTGVNDLTPHVYEYVWYKPQTRAFVDMQAWTNLEKVVPTLEIFHHGVQEMVEQWEMMEKPSELEDDRERVQGGGG